MNHSVSRLEHPPDHRSHALHYVLVASDLVARLPTLALVPICVGLAALACWPWPRALRLPAALLTLSSMVVDGTGLILLGRMGRLFGPPAPTQMAMAIGRTGLTAGLGWLWPTPEGLVATSLLQSAGEAALIYSTWVEPFRIQVTRMSIRSPKLTGRVPLRLLHLSDIHVERRTAREEQLVRLVSDMAPDVVVLTGDYLNLSYVRDARAHADARALLAELCAASGGPVYAVTGSPSVDLPDVVPAIFEGLPITWLMDRIEVLEIKGHVVQVAGLRCNRERSVDVPRLRDLLSGRRDGLFTLLLYHSPDLMPEASDEQVDLYLCGHTHGGQIRVPLFGALVTSSAFWKRYEDGLYRQGVTTLYVSRGIGMEGLGAPRARLLAPPEVVLWELAGEETARAV